MSAITRADGRFELVADEAREFEARVTSLDQTVVYGTRSITVPDADTYAVELSFTGVPVSGTVLDKATQQPIAEARVTAIAKIGDGPGSVGASSAR